MTSNTLFIPEKTWIKYHITVNIKIKVLPLPSGKWQMSETSRIKSDFRSRELDYETRKKEVYGRDKLVVICNVM